MDEAIKVYLKWLDGAKCWFSG